MECLEVLRHLPGRRRVLRGRLDGRDVAVKTFFGPGARRRCRRERRGLSLLAAAGVPTPGILAEGRFDEGWWIAVEWVHARAATRMDGEAIVVLNAALRAAGVRHDDPHLGNFVVAGDRVFVVDGDSVARARIGRRASVAGLGLQLAALDADAATVDGSYRVYCAARNWRTNEGECRRLHRSVARMQRRRVRRFLAKTLRPCSQFDVRRGNGWEVVYERSAICPELEGLLASPGPAVEAGERLKDGNTATVARVESGSRRYVVKRYNAKANRARRAWVNGHRLCFRNIPTARPVALVAPTGRGPAYLVLEDLGGVPLDDQVARHGLDDATADAVGEAVRSPVAGRPDPPGHQGVQLHRRRWRRVAGRSRRPAPRAFAARDRRGPATLSRELGGARRVASSRTRLRACPPGRPCPPGQARTGRRDRPGALRSARARPVRGVAGRRGDRGGRRRGTLRPREARAGQDAARVRALLPGGGRRAPRRGHRCGRVSLRPGQPPRSRPLAIRGAALVRAGPGTRRAVQRQPAVPAQPAARAGSGCGARHRLGPHGVPARAASPRPRIERLSPLGLRPEDGDPQHRRQGRVRDHVPGRGRRRPHPRAQGVLRPRLPPGGLRRHDRVPRLRHAGRGVQGHGHGALRPAGRLRPVRAGTPNQARLPRQHAAPQHGGAPSLSRGRTRPLLRPRRWYVGSGPRAGATRRTSPTCTTRRPCRSCTRSAVSV